VAGVLTEHREKPAPAGLICLASRFLKATAGLARNVIDEAHRHQAVQNLLKDLGINKEDPSPHGNRFLLCFLPGSLKHDGRKLNEAVSIHRAIRDATKARIPMVGGVSGDDARRESCWQFFGDQVVVEHAVVVMVETDVRFGIGMEHGLESTGKHVFARDVSNGGYSITNIEMPVTSGYEIKPATEVLAEYEKEHGKVLFGGVIPAHQAEPVVFYPHRQEDGSVLTNQKGC
jgi:hypothetical protein